MTCWSGEGSRLCPDPGSLRLAAAFSFRPHQRELPHCFPWTYEILIYPSSGEEKALRERDVRLGDPATITP